MAKYLQGAIAAEEKMDKEGRTDEVLASVTEMAARLLPAKEAAGRAASADGGGVLRLLDRAHWAKGWLHVLTGRSPRPVEEEDLEGVAIMLGDVLANWSQGAAEAVTQNRADGHRPPTTAEHGAAQAVQKRPSHVP
ncbi:hypothetical protein [Streptomyces sp. NPDC056308]|uniref:hypothetical protein n=1 Tax=Streptomyces sp. NPDC056308 TaxID=3345780 RepID=UPI0035D9CB53